MMSPAISFSVGGMIPIPIPVPVYQFSIVKENNTKSAVIDTSIFLYYDSKMSTQFAFVRGKRK